MMRMKLKSLMDLKNSSINFYIIVDFEGNIMMIMMIIIIRVLGVVLVVVILEGKKRRFAKRGNNDRLT